MKKKRPNSSFQHQKGIGLIIVMLILAFMSIVGMTLLSITRTGSQISGNIRTHEQAFNAAEAGFDAAWAAIQDSFIEGQWINFGEQYVTEPAGIDIPTDALYFRKLTDLEILAYFDPDGDGTPNVNNVLFFKQPYVYDGNGNLDHRYTYTVFLINDEAGGAPVDERDVILITIGTVGTGTNLTTSRIEVELEKN